MAKKKYYRLDGTIEDTDQEKNSKTLESINKELQLQQPALAKAAETVKPSNTSFIEDVGNKTAYLGKKIGSGILRAGTGAVDSVLQETQNDLQEGAKRDQNWYNKNALQTLAGILMPGGTYAVKQFTKQFDKEYQKKNVMEKILDNVNDLKEATMPVGLKEAVRTYGSFDKQYLGGKAPKNVENLSNTINKPSEDFSKSLAEEGKNYSDFLNFSGDVLEQVGHMAPSIATTAITKDPNLGLTAMGISAKGSSTREALQKGADLNTAIKIGDAKALVEVGTEKLTGGLNYFGKGALDDVAKTIVDKGIKQPVINFLAKQGLAIGGEVLEEVIADVMDYLIDKGTIDPNAELTLDDLGNTALQTIASTVILNLLGGSYSKAGYNQNLNEMNETYNKIRDNNGTNKTVKGLNETLKQQNPQYEQKGNIVQEVIEDANLDNGKDNLYMPEIIESYPIGEEFETQTNQNTQNEQLEVRKTRNELAKEKQLEIIKQFNPAKEGSQQAWVRSVDDIKTFKETLNDAEYTPDFTKADMKKALKSGEITVYSSTPIRQGAFVTPSQMEAQNYAGNGKVYSKTIPISEVAWLDNLQGQYAKIPNEIRNYNQDVQTEKSAILTEMPKEKSTLSQKIDKTIKKGRYDFVDHLAPIYDLSRQTKNPTLYHYADLTQNSGALAQNMVGKRQSNLSGKAYTNFIDENGNKTSMGLEKAFDLYNDIPVEAKNAYLVNTRNMDNLKQGLNQFDISYEDSAKTIKQLKKEYPQINKWAKNIWQYNYNQLQNMVDAGLISQEYANQLKKDNPHYVRIQRNMNSQNGTLQSKGKNVKVNNQIQKVKGSTLEILPIKETMGQYTQQITRSALLNQFGQEYARTVGIDSQGQNVSDIQEMFGIDNDVLKKTEDGYTFTIYDNGKPITIPINKDIYQSLQSRDIRTLPVLNTASKGMRELITGKNPYFALSNAVRDASDMFLYSKHPFTKSISTYTKLFTGRTVGKNMKIFGATPMELVEFYENTGNLSNTYFSNGEFESSKPKNIIKKGIDTITSPVEKANNFIESMPRITEFWNTIDANGYMLQDGELVAKPGVTPSKTVQQTIAEASYNAAEITVNFKRGGTWAKNLDRNGATFFNAAVQGADKFGRTFSEAFQDAKSGDFKAAKRLFARAMTLGVAPALLSGIMYKDDKDYEELSDYVKERYYVFKIPNTDQFIRIPKGRAVSIFENAAKRTGDFIGGDKKAFVGFDKLIMDQIAPNNPLESNVIAPLLSVANNKSWSGNKIVSDYLNENYDPDLQYDAKTSEISKGIAKGIKFAEDKTGINTSDFPVIGDFMEKAKSPKNIDYLIDQYSGVIGDIVLPSTTNYAENEDSSSIKALINPLISKFTTNSTTNNKAISEYNELKSKTIKQGNRDDATLLDKAKKYYFGKYGEVNTTLNSLYAEQREIQNNTELSDSEKYKQNKKVQKEINEFMNKVIKDINNATEEDGVVTIGDNSYISTTDDNGNEKIKKVKK